MCEYCGEKTKEERRALENGAIAFNRRLESLGRWYIAAAQGRPVRHNAKSTEAAKEARGIIRRLVEDWL